ncbi:uncharacterized protein A4U43_C08F11140 [Asparagus officinalis]|uniref:cyclin-D1-1-like n=1 Tax=Asparagus officinalis TaxID=4686 RepID=UPI00098E4F6C|nr:cyclin-D1-1-like [Asparagus officinalis]ONK59819.1 uncharacterized protein A4U43_C08F11140 [Asparagus officinalis]
MQPLSPSSFLCPESPYDVASWDSDEWAPLETAAGESPISLLLADEAELMPITQSLPPNPIARLNAVNWILNVNEFYRFRPATAFLAVNYLDRFLSSRPLPGQNGESGGWPMQLLAVACVSVAAKMEETHVPLLLDLQILDPKFVFESKTIMRMELLLMSALKWRMRSVTPFDFVAHFVDSMKPEIFGRSRAGLISRVADLVLRTCRVVEFSGCRPSEIAAAAIIRAAKDIPDISDGESTDLLKLLKPWVNEESLNTCLKLLQDSSVEKPLQEPTTPQSPIGVIDAAACRSSESQRSSAAATPPLKRRRLDESLCIESKNGVTKSL